MLRPKNCKKCGGKVKMQPGGQVPCPEGMTFNPSTQECEVPGTDTQYFQSGFTQDPYGNKQAIGYNPMEGTYEQRAQAEQFATTNPMINQQHRNQFNTQFLPFGLRGLTTGLSELSGIIERGRQNQQDYKRQAALGQMNPIPVENFQPNPYSLYAKYGGQLKKYQKGGRQPIYTDNPKDPRLRAYNDSTRAYNSYLEDDDFAKRGNPVLTRRNMQGRYPDKSVLNNAGVGAFQTNIKPVGYNNYNYAPNSGFQNSDNKVSVPIYKEPVQPVILKEGKQPVIYKKKQAPVKNQPTYEDSLAVYNKARKSYLEYAGPKNWGSQMFNQMEPEKRAYAKEWIGGPEDFGAKKGIKPIGLYTDTYSDVPSFMYKKPVGQPQPVEPKITRPAPMSRTTPNFNMTGQPVPAAPNMQRAEFDSSKPTPFSFTNATGNYLEGQQTYFPDEQTLRRFAEQQRNVSIQASGTGATATGYLRGMQYGGGVWPRKIKNSTINMFQMPGPSLSSPMDALTAMLGTQNPDFLSVMEGLRQAAAMKKGGPSPSKAREMLKDGTANGKKLTARQKRYFGWIYGKSKK